MCGRYYIDINDKEFKKISDELERSLYDYKTGEIYPTDKAPIYIDNNIKPILAQWGFPKWDSKGIIINARVETLTEKPVFKKLINTNRCIVPASAFYEWKRDNSNSNSKTKDKYIFKNPDSPLYIAGLYNEITTYDDNKQISLFDYDKVKKQIYFTIITKEANVSVSHIHNRMPLILNKNEMYFWLNGKCISELTSNDNVFLFSELIK